MPDQDDQALRALKNIADPSAKTIITQQHAEIEQLRKLVKDLADNQCKCPQTYSMDTR